MLTSHALASRLRSKRHDNAKEGSPACPALQRSIESLNSCHRSRNIAESPADTVGEYTLQAAMDLRLRTLRLTGPRKSALVRHRRRPWLRLNRWFATQGRPTSIACPDRDLHSTGERSLGPSDEAHRSLNSSIRTEFSTHGDQCRFLIGSHLGSTWVISVHHVLTVGIQGRSICRPSPESYSTHGMFLWKTSAVDRGTKPRALESRGRPTR